MGQIFLGNGWGKRFLCKSQRFWKIPENLTSGLKIPENLTSGLTPYWIVKTSWKILTWIRGLATKGLRRTFELIINRIHCPERIFQVIGRISLRIMEVSMETLRFLCGIPTGDLALRRIHVLLRAGHLASAVMACKKLQDSDRRRYARQLVRNHLLALKNS